MLIEIAALAVMVSSFLMSGLWISRSLNVSIEVIDLTASLEKLENALKVFLAFNGRLP
jgi:hypothetical protein